jgi:hypothetical protein
MRGEEAVAIRSTVLGMLIFAAAISAAFAEDQPPVQSEEELQWTEFQSPERGFAVSFPGSPKTMTTPVGGQNPLLQYAFEVNVGEDTVYSVVVFEYPAGKGPKPDNDAYVKLMNAYAKGSGSRLRKRGKATIAGYQGFEGISDDGKGKLSHLIDIVPSSDRLYMLATAGPRGHATSDDAKRFRDSFRLLGDGAAPPEQSAETPPTP